MSRRYDWIFVSSTSRYANIGFDIRAAAIEVSNREGRFIVNGGEGGGFRLRAKLHSVNDDSRDVG